MADFMEKHGEGIAETLASLDGRIVCGVLAAAASLGVMATVALAAAASPQIGVIAFASCALAALAVVSIAALGTGRALNKEKAGGECDRAALLELSDQLACEDCTQEIAQRIRECCKA